MRIKRFLITSMFFASIGEWIYFIALNIRVLDLTDSAFAVSGLYLIMPIAMLLTNSWTGSVVDRINIKRLLFVLSSIRAVFVICIVFLTDLWLIYSLSLLLQMAASIHHITEMVYITRLIPKEEQQQFNGWRSLAQSSGFVIGPSIAGGLFIIGSVETAIAVNGIILLFLAIIYTLLPTTKAIETNKCISFNTFVEDWQITITFALKHRYVAVIFLINSLFIVIITSIDSLEAAFSMQILQLSEASYGVLVTVAGIGFIMGSLVNIKWILLPSKAMKYGMLFSACGYVLFSFSTSWSMAAIGFFLISGSLPFVNVGFMTFIQRNLKEELLGRFLSIFSLAEALGVISLTVIFGYLTNSVSIRSLILTGVVLLFFVFTLFLFVDWLKGKSRK